MHRGSEYCLVVATFEFTVVFENVPSYLFSQRPYGCMYSATARVAVQVASAPDVCIILVVSVPAIVPLNAGKRGSGQPNVLTYVLVSTPKVHLDVAIWDSNSAEMCCVQALSA